MKKLFFIFLLSLTGFSYAQHTLIPDIYFEYFLVAAEIDDQVDGHVLTSNIENLTDYPKKDPTF